MSGIRPTGFLHLGNYFGAVKNYVRMQEGYECFFMVADLHSLTTHPDTREQNKMFTGYWLKILPAVSIPIKWRFIVKAMFMKPANCICT